MKPEKKWCCCAPLSVMPGIAAMLTTALCFTACGSIRTTEKRWHVSHEELTTVSRPSLPTVEAEIALPIDQLKALPEGVKVSERRQHTTVTFSRKGDTVRLIARCDSVMGESTTHRLLGIVNEGKSERQRPDSIVSQLLRNALLSLLFVLLIVIFCKCLLRRFF